MISYFPQPEQMEPLFAPGGEPVFKSIARTVYRPDDRSLFAVHLHTDEVEISFISKGEGVRLCGMKRYSVKQGDILIHNAGVLHEENTMRGDTVSYCCNIRRMRLLGMPENVLLPAGECPVLPAGAQFERVRALMKMIYSLHCERPSGYAQTAEQLMRAYIALILGLLEERRQGAGEAEKNCPAGEENTVCECVKRYIDEHYASELTLEMISKAVHISPYYLSRVFKRETGYSPMQYVNHRRLGEAQTLLTTTHKQVTQIAMEAGFDTLNNFNKMFAKQVGMSPSRFRKAFFEAESTQGADD
ncbi:MAG TPA: hypothetical protein DD414_01645 [Lachnospiraceae bacterium]|nr:hypothetical protein [Lachnospiraceae bacterium]